MVTCTIRALPQADAARDTPGGAGHKPLRLFFGIFPPPEVAQALTAAAQAAHPLCGGRITRPENLHITLAFLGRASAAQATELAALTRATAAPAGEVVIDRYGSFRRAQVVWAGPDPDSEGAHQLRDMSDELWLRLRDLGWPGPDVWPLRPHVTLLHKADKRDTGELAFAPVTWRHQGYALVASEPAPGGSRYRVLARTG